MDNNSPESKEIDAALLAQCTCGGVAGSRACTIECAIFSGYKLPEGLSIEEKLNIARGRAADKSVPIGALSRSVASHRYPSENNVPEVPVEYGRGLINTLKQLAEQEGPVREAHKLLDSAMRYIGGMGGNVEMTEGHITLLRQALTTTQHVVHEEPKKFCPACGSDKVNETIEDKELSFFDGDIKSTFKVVMAKCAVCELSWLDHRAEEAEMQAIYKLLYSEVVSLRHRMRK